VPANVTSTVNDVVIDRSSFIAALQSRPSTC
jgi:hypothetical protein